MMIAQIRRQSVSRFMPRVYPATGEGAHRTSNPMRDCRRNPMRAKRSVL